MNLNLATNEQLEQYREAVAKTLNLDPLMLDYIWLDDSETGLKNRVLYAKRGAAEILRQQLNISVLSMEHYESNGWLMFTAIGKDGKGRQEIAHGAAYIEGHKADKKAHGVMTASTRALRRLTLQFVGGGILDETEVQAQTTLGVAPAASQAALAGSPTVLPPPQAPISQVPGKDITITTVVPCLPAAPILVNQAENLKQVYADGAKALADMKPATTTYSVAQNPPQPEPAQTVALDYLPVKQPDIKADIPAEEPRKKRPYRRKNQVDIASPGQSQQTEMPVGHINAAGQITPISVPPATANEPEQGTIGNGQLQLPALAEPIKPIFNIPEPLASQPATTIAMDVLQAVMAVKGGAQTFPPTSVPQSVVSVLSKEKQDEYRGRLAKYYNDILPRGGMQSSEGIGGPTMKVRKFAAIHTGVADTKLMTEQHWGDLFEFLDANADKPKFLVDYINRALGVA